MGQIRGKQIADNSLDAKKISGGALEAIVTTKKSIIELDDADDKVLISKEFVTSKVAVVQGEVDALETKQATDYADALDAVLAEETRATQQESDIRDEFASADTIIKGKVDAEEAARIAADTAIIGEATADYNTLGKLETQLKTEVTRASDAEAALLSDLADETSARVAADATLQSNITDEETARIAADAALQSNITDEETARIAADATLQNNITDEETARIAADAALQSSMDTLATKQADDHTVALQAATDAETSAKAYTDAMAQGLMIKEAVRVATSANLDLADVVTEIDGISLLSGDRILVKNQTDKTENGVYVVDGSNMLVRAEDMDAPEEFRKNTFMFVSEGAVLADTGWVMTVPNEAIVTVGQSTIEFTQFSSAGIIEAGVAMTKTGNVLDVQVDASTIEIHTNKLRIKDGGVADAKIVTVSASKATLTAISGLTASNVQAAVAELKSDIVTDASNLATHINNYNSAVTTLQTEDAAIRTAFAAADTAIIGGATTGGNTLKKLEDKISALDTSTAAALAASDGDGLLWNNSTKKLDVVAGNGLAVESDKVTLELSNYVDTDAVSITTNNISGMALKSAMGGMSIEAKTGVVMEGETITTVVNDSANGNSVHMDIDFQHVELSAFNADDTLLGTGYFGFDRIDFIHDTATSSEQITMKNGIALTTSGAKGITITGKAAEYAASYSFTDRSLVDKAYVDGKVSGDSLNNVVDFTSKLGSASGSGISEYTGGGFSVATNSKTVAQVFVNGIRVTIAGAAFFSNISSGTKRTMPIVGDKLFFDLALIGYEIEANIDHIQVSYFV